MYQENALYKEVARYNYNRPEASKKLQYSHRIGLENYDKRHGWRGPIENIK